MVDVDELVMEYAAAADQVDQLSAALALATRERNAVLAAMAAAGLTYRQMTGLTGLTAAIIRTGLFNAARADRTITAGLTWKPARPGDTPAGLVPGEDDITAEPRATVSADRRPP